MEQPLPSLKLLLTILASTVWSCGRQQDSKTNALSACDGLFGKQYNECINSKSGFNSVSASLSSNLGTMGGMMVKGMVGSVLSVRYAGDYKDCNIVASQRAPGCGLANQCLSTANGNVVWETCNPLKIEQQFHFLEESPIRFSLHPGVTHESVAFRIATRASVMSHFRSADESPNQKFLCLEANQQGATLVKCDNASYFMTLMNRYDDDNDMARKKENQYVSLVALVADSKRITQSKNAEEEKSSSFLDNLFEDESKKEDNRNKDAQRANRKYINLGNFADRKDCNQFMLLSNVKGRAVGTCPSQDIRQHQNTFSENHVFVHPCGDPNLDKGADCKGLDPIKNYYDFSESREWGVVVKMLPKGEGKSCLQVQGNFVKEVNNCDQNASDNPSIQFRSEVLGSEDIKNGKSLIKLRSMLNPALCADLSSEKLVDCRKAPKLTFDPVSNDILVRKGSGYKSYFMSMCTVATSHKKNNRYDCQREVPWQYALYERLSIGLSFIPIVGFIPATVFDGLLCTSNEEQYAEAGCVGLGLDISLGILFGDFMPLFSISKGVGKSVANKGAAIMANSFKTPSARLAISRSVMRTGLSHRSASSIFTGINKPIIKALAKGSLSGKQLLDVFKKARQGDQCLGTNCAGWWNPAPKAGEETKEYLSQLKDSVTQSTLSSSEKKTVLKAISEAERP